MEKITMTLTDISPETAKSILAGLTSTDSDASEPTHTSQSKSKSATKTGKTSKKAAEADEDDVQDEEYSGDDEETDTEVNEDEAEEADFTVPQVQKLMAKLASEKNAATAKKLLAKYKVQKVNMLKQPKLNQLAQEIEGMLE